MTDTFGLNQQSKELNTQKNGNYAEASTTVATSTAAASTAEYTKRQPRCTKYSVPDRIIVQGEQRHKEVRERHNITVEGEDVPPPLETFKEMLLPRPLLTIFRRKIISFPSPIQMQSVPAVLSGRDVVAISSPGSGKSFVYMISTVYFCLEKELNVDLKRNDGPQVLVLCHSSDLAQQAHDLLYKHFHKVWSDVHLDMIKPLACTVLLDGPGKEPFEKRKVGIHVIVATPRRILDSLGDESVSLAQCFMLCLDQADDLFDKYSEEIKTVMSYLKGPRQTLVVSSTMTPQISNFVDDFLVRPIVVNVKVPLDFSRIQQYVDKVLSQEDKLSKLLVAVKKTDRPVVIFTNSDDNVETVVKFLNYEKVGYHALCSKMNLKDRLVSLELFTTYKIGKHGLMVTTDEASKGLNFPDIQHVINYDMPDNINVYYHRIARTGRWNLEGKATTFIDDSCSPSIQLKLKSFLVETNQTVPNFLSHLKPKKSKRSRERPLKSSQD